MTSVGSERTARDKRGGISRRAPTSNTWQGLMKINASTGEMTPIYKGHAPSNGAVLATAGDLVFWGDLDHKFRAFDADSGKVLWEQKLNGPVQNSTITYAVNGKQYVAVLTGVGLITGGHHRPGRHQAESHLQRALCVRACLAARRTPSRPGLQAGPMCYRRSSHVSDGDLRSAHCGWRAVCLRRFWCCPG